MNDEMTNNEIIEMVIVDSKGRIKYANKTLADWRDTMAEDPFYAFNNAEIAIQATADQAKAAYKLKGLF